MFYHYEPVALLFHQVVVSEIMKYPENSLTIECVPYYHIKKHTHERTDWPRSFHTSFYFESKGRVELHG